MLEHASSDASCFPVQLRQFTRPGVRITRRAGRTCSWGESGHRHLTLHALKDHVIVVVLSSAGSPAETWAAPRGRTRRRASLGVGAGPGARRLLLFLATKVKILSQGEGRGARACLSTSQRRCATTAPHAHAAPRHAPPRFFPGRAELGRRGDP